MKDNDIIKALEHCPKCVYGSCPECPMYGVNGCDSELMKLALDLINRQKAEIERLERSAKQWEDTAKDLYISRENIKAEAVKEFADRLKAVCRQARFSVTVTQDLTGIKKVLDNIPVVDESDINNLVKEMVGAESG